MNPKYPTDLGRLACPNELPDRGPFCLVTPTSEHEVVDIDGQDHDLKLLKAGFKTIPDNLDSVLKGSTNIWFSGETNLEITVLIDATVSNYFKRRKMFPTQEIKEERPDGSLVVSFRVGHYEAIRNILKSWIPNILILSPADLKDGLLKDVKEWVKKQEKK